MLIFQARYLQSPTSPMTLGKDRNEIGHIEFAIFTLICEQFNYMRTILIGLLLFSTISSVVFGLMMILHPLNMGMNLSLHYLNDTPFRSYFFPGILLLTLVGSSSFYGLVQLWRNRPNCIRYSFVAGICLSLWIMMQMLLIPNAAGISGLYLLIALFILLSSAQLRDIEVL